MESQQQFISDIGDTMRRNLSEARGVLKERGLKSAESISQKLLNDYGVELSPTSINRFQRDDGPIPPLIIYIHALAMFTGAPIDALIGAREWTAEERRYPIDDPDLAEIVRMYESLSEDKREMVFAMIYSAMLVDNGIRQDGELFAPPSAN